MNWQGGNDPNVPELRRRIEHLEGKIATNKITISEEGLREAIRSILAGTRSPGYYRDTIDACVRAVKEFARRENNACNS
jgi:hypothetical protein